MTETRKRLIANIKELAANAELNNELAAASVLLVLAQALTVNAEVGFAGVCENFSHGLTAGVQARRN
jgi:hypothetical protein